MADPSPTETEELPEELLNFIKPELQPGECLPRTAHARRAGSAPRRGGYWVAGTWAFGLPAAGVVTIALSIRAEAWVRRVGAGLVAFGRGFVLGKFEGIVDARKVEELVRRFLVAPGPDSTP